MIRKHQITSGLTKLVLIEGQGAVPDVEDTVYYRHETRFDNGQLVDLDERRKVADKCPLSDQSFHDFLRTTLLTMKKGEVVYLKIGEETHAGLYHNSKMSIIRSAEEKQKILSVVGPDIYMKLSLTNIKRDPKCEQQAPWSDRIQFYNKVRITGKELCE